jgi:hypothetical protein
VGSAFGMELGLAVGLAVGCSDVGKAEEGACVGTLVGAAMGHPGSVEPNADPKATVPL